jgi:succinate dehydrogenase / fumarate reductase, cytochrome b subunit
MASVAVEGNPAGSKTSYILDKLHSLSGIIPIGAFLLEHFWSNSYALVSAQKYNEVSFELQSIPWRWIVEFTFIWAPIAFHGLYGLWIWWKGKQNAFAHPWMANWMYLLQRWTGIVAFAFIGWHVYTERFATHGRSTYQGVAGAMMHPWYFAFYIVGVLAASFHLGNGVWNFACKWGIAVSPRGQRWWAWFGALTAVVFAFLGVMVAVGFLNQWFPLSGYVR